VVNFQSFGLQIFFNFPDTQNAKPVYICLLEHNQQTPQLAQFAFYLKVFDDEA
jgi:hypothetical protein